MTDDDRLDLMMAYAADSLDESERQAVRARLAAGDPMLVGALAEAREVLALTGATVEPVTPSPDLRRRLLGGLPAQEQRLSERGRTASAGHLSLANGTPSSATGSPAPSMLSPSASTSVAAAPPSRMRLDGRPATWPRLAIAAAIGALLVGGPAAYWAASSRSQFFAEQAARTTAEQRLAVATDFGQSLLRRVGSPEVKFAAMNDAAAGKPAGRVMWDADGRECHVWVFDLAPPPPGKVYQLWFLPDGGGKPIPSQTFMVDAGGKGEVIAQLPAGVTKANAAVSEELAGGAIAPTLVRLVGNL